MLNVVILLCMLQMQKKFKNTNKQTNNRIEETSQMLIHSTSTLQQDKQVDHLNFSTDFFSLPAELMADLYNTLNKLILQIFHSTGWPPKNVPNFA